MGYLKKFRNYLAQKMTTQKRVAIRRFDGAQGGRKTAGWMASNTSQDAEVQAAFNVLRNRARDLGRNNNNVRSYLSGLEVNVIGQGIRLQSVVKDETTGITLKDVNAKIENEWKRWARKESCDVRGMLSFQDIERLIIRTLAESGESPIIRFVYQKFGRSDVRLSLQILESDHLDANYNIKAINGKNEIRMGVEINEFGRPVAYWLLTQHPGDQGNSSNSQGQFRVRVPASEIIHFYKHERPAQSRAVTWIASTMLTLRQLGEYLDAATMRKKVEAAVMYFITKPVSELSDAGALDTGVQDNQNVIDVEGGAVFNLNEGENVISPPISATSGADAPFIQNALNNVAAGVGSSYETISRDFSKTNYSSSRLSLMSERDLYKIIQSWIEGNFHQPVFEKFMLMAYTSGVFGFKDYLDNQEKYDQPRWMPRGFDWIDPYKDVLAEKEELKGNLITLSDALASRGLDFEETILQIKKEKDFMKLNDVTPDYLLEVLVTKPIVQGEPNAQN